MSPPATTLSNLGIQVGQVQDTLKALTDEMRKLNEQALDRRVSRLEGTVSWLSRTLGAAIVVAIVSAVGALVGIN